MLDTNMVSYIVRSRSMAARARLLTVGANGIAYISSITEAEIRYGLAKKPDATALRNLIDAFLASIRVLPWGRDEAAAYGQVRAALEQRGVTLGNMDMMIAAHAVTVQAVLVTADQAFSHVDQLRAIENWAIDINL